MGIILLRVHYPWCVASPSALTEWPNLAYRGTSFSAPSLTALLASRLTSTSVSCLPKANTLDNRPVDTSCF